MNSRTATRGRELKVRASVRKVLLSGSSSDSDTCENGDSSIFSHGEAAHGVDVGEGSEVLQDETTGDHDSDFGLSKDAADEFAAEIRALENELLAETERMRAARVKICELETLLDSEKQTSLQLRCDIERLNRDLESETHRRELAAAELVVLKTSLDQAKTRVDDTGRRQRAIEFDSVRQHRHITYRHAIQMWRLTASASSEFRYVNERTQHDLSVALAALFSTQTLLRDVVKEVELASSEEQKRRDEMQRMAQDLSKMTSSGIRSSEIVSVFADTAGTN